MLECEVTKETAVNVVDVQESQDTESHLDISHKVTMASTEGVPTPARLSLAVCVRRSAKKNLGWFMKDIIGDLKGRAPFYVHDWTDGWDIRCDLSLISCG
jgi:hypothetical protein